jgi:hypothetical protein
MDWLQILLIIGAVSTILNFAMNIVATATALKRTRMQTDLYKWKREEFDKEHPGYKEKK